MDSPDSISLAEEYDRLKLETASLEQEHKVLQNNPYNHVAHEMHRARLRAHIAALHAHLERLRARGD